MFAIVDIIINNVYSSKHSNLVEWLIELKKSQLVYNL